MCLPALASKGEMRTRRCTPRSALRIAVGVVARDLEGDGLDARLVALQQVELLDLEAHALAEAGVHAVEHLRPVLRLGAARAGVQRQNAVAGVVLDREAAWSGAAAEAPP